MERNALVKNASTPVVLAGGGVVLLLAGGVLPWLEWPIIVVAAGLGLYNLFSRKGDKSTGFLSLATAAGVYLLYGPIASVISGVSRFAGWVLLGGAALSLISRLFRRNRTGTPSSGDYGD